MSTAAGAPPNGANPAVASPESKNKGKGKRVTSPDVSMEEDDEEEEDDDEDEDDEMELIEEGEDDEEEEGDDPEIDTSAIITRRTRGVKVNYASKEALEKAGLDPEEEEEED